MNHGKLYLKGCNHEVCSMNHKKTTFRRCNFEILHDESCLWKNNTLCGKMGQKYDLFHKNPIYIFECPLNNPSK
jgi:hypothetical protein